MVPDTLEQVFRLLTGQAAVPPEFVEALSGIDDPLEVRRRILNRPELYRLVPEWRLSHEIRALREARARRDIRLIVGAAGTGAPGWVSTNVELLNLLHPRQWQAWLAPGSVTVILAEHVWQELDREEGRRACETCATFLAEGGRLRIAVPDALHPDPEYAEIIRVGGMHGHKSAYTYRTLSALMRETGFDVALLEYWDETGGFHEHDWEPADGRVHRSRRFDPRNSDGVLRFTSLIVDGIKRLSGG